MGRKGKKKQQEQKGPSEPFPGTSQGTQPTPAPSGEQQSPRPTTSSRSKSDTDKKTQSSDQKGSFESSSGSLATTSTVVSEQGLSTSSAQHGEEDWCTPSPKGRQGSRDKPSRPGDARSQPSYQGQRKEGQYQSGRGWEKSGGQLQQDTRPFRKTDNRSQQSGGHAEQWRSSSGLQKFDKEQGSDKEQWRARGQPSASRRKDEQVVQQPQKEEGSWHRKEHYTGELQGQVKRPQAYSRHEDKRNVGGNVSQPVREDTSQQPSPPKVAEEAPNVWQKRQTPDRKDWKANQPKMAEGAPDKVQLPSSSTPSTLPSQGVSKSSTTEVTRYKMVPVHKEPGTLARKKIVVQSNHFGLNLGYLEEAYHYDVKITEFDEKKQHQTEKTPEQGPNKDKISRNRRVKDKVKYRVVQEFLRKHFRDRNPSFDGRQNLYASRPLKENLNEVLIDTDITVIDDFEKPKTFSIEIMYVKTISLLPVQAEHPHPPMLTQNAIQCIEVVFRNAPIRCFNQIGGSFFSKPRDKIIELGGGMEMYYGFYQAVVTGGRPFLNVHLVHKAFPKSMPVLDAFVEIIKGKDQRSRYSYENLTSLKAWQKRALNEYIENLKVAYVVPNKPKVIYRVNELVRSPREEIMMQNGVRKTILEYFRTEKSYNIQNPDLPLLWVGNKKGNIKILIPPELCTIEKDQSVKRKMEDYQTSNMIRVAATNTHVHRENTMQRFIDARYETSPCVREFGFSVNDKFEETTARILPTPQLEYNHGEVATVTKGTWQNKEFLVAKTIKKWAIVDISNGYVDKDKINMFISEFRNTALSCGVDIKSYPIIDSIQGRGHYGPTKSDVEGYFKEQKTKNYDIIFVIIPSTEQGTSIYSFVKGAAELSAGCLTQCITSRTLTGKIRFGKFDAATAKNILLKVNGKLDGVNHTFAPMCKPKILRDNRPVMIMGADVTHPGPTAGNMPSVAAVIASHDPRAFQYNLCLRLQKPSEDKKQSIEYIIDLKEVVKQQLLFYIRKNDCKPEKIIFFRDGVSEGQFAHVLNIELSAIKDACKEMQGDGYDPAVTFLVVQKRHHTRLFPKYDKDSEDQDQRRGDKTVYGNYNVPAGTCVDTNIVHPTMQNFYLVSHASIKGVSRPTKYCTLWDDLHLTNDEIQELSYYLCHMFARCNRSVSYPAPTYYAHLGALRGKAYIKPALDSNSFDMDNLQREMARIQIQFNILDENPMFFI